MNGHIPVMYSCSTTRPRWEGDNIVAVTTEAHTGCHQVMKRCENQVVNHLHKRVSECTVVAFDLIGQFVRCQEEKNSLVSSLKIWQVKILWQIITSNIISSLLETNQSNLLLCLHFWFFILTWFSFPLLSLSRCGTSKNGLHQQQQQPILTHIFIFSCVSGSRALQRSPWEILTDEHWRSWHHPSKSIY